ncbi:alpha/beta hydrolase [Streptomyces monashensis]|uniref:alpha/beta fold hydrolase n=1 Tax=Streptomyces monashensis TaxID=1678012 RepID=UPI0033E20C6A
MQVGAVDVQGRHHRPAVVIFWSPINKTVPTVGSFLIRQLRGAGPDGVVLIGRRDEHRLLATIPVGIPVLIIAGEEDSQFPVHAVRRMADAIKGSTFRVLLRTGHLAARENPGEVNTAIDAILAARPVACPDDDARGSEEGEER